MAVAFPDKVSQPVGDHPAGGQCGFRCDWELANCLIIAALVLFSVTLDFVQEHRAGRAAERLRQSISLQATVVRDGETRRVPVADIVPGDTVVLSAGDLVPADGRLLIANDFFVQQSLLTGESYPVEKQVAELPGDQIDVQDARNAVFMGTSLVLATTPP